MLSCIPVNYEWFLNRSIWPIDGTLTGITTLGQSGPGSNGNEGVLKAWIVKWEQSNHIDLIKDSIWNFQKTNNNNRHLEKAGWQNSWNVMIITTKIRITVHHWKISLMNFFFFLSYLWFSLVSLVNGISTFMGFIKFDVQEVTLAVTL